MNNEERTSLLSYQRIVKWKCPECGNYHKWVWSTYDIFGGEITMTCDNPECGRTSKMYMIVEKNGNATALVADNSQVEEKLRRATEKVMNSQTEIDISKVLISPIEQTKKDIEKLQQRLKLLEYQETVRTDVEKAYRDFYGHYPIIDMSTNDYDAATWVAFKEGYKAGQKND
jgi:hypothetical protein